MHTLQIQINDNLHQRLAAQSSAMGITLEQAAAKYLDMTIPAKPKTKLITFEISSLLLREFTEVAAKQDFSIKKLIKELIREEVNYHKTGIEEV